MVTSLSAEVLVTVIEYVTWPPGSLTTAGDTLFDTRIDDGWSTGGGVLFFVLTKMHVTVSPALSWIEPGELSSLQVAEVSVQPSGVDSVDGVRTG